MFAFELNKGASYVELVERMALPTKLVAFQKLVSALLEYRPRNFPHQETGSPQIDRISILPFVVRDEGISLASD